MADPFPISVPILALIGPTAIGKTSLSLKLARLFDCEIISMDSMQVYRYMDIGTAKITREEMEGIVHHGIDLVDPDDEYHAARFVHDSLEAIELIRAKGKRVLITGGTGLYLRALTEGLARKIPVEPGIRRELQGRLVREGGRRLLEELAKIDPETVARIHENDHYRLLRGLEIYHSTGQTWSAHLRKQRREETSRFSNLLEIGLTCDRQHLYQRIDQRTVLMKEQGLEQEVSRLMQMGYDPELKSMKGLGYRHCVNLLQGEWDAETTYRLLARDTRHYAKRQYTWFQKFGPVRWFDVAQQEEIIDVITDWYTMS